MLDLLTWLESSALADTLRGAGVWTYALLNLGHIIGISLLFGAVLILDLRLMGVWRGLPLALIARCTVPVAATGVVLAIGTGIMMISFNASEYYGNPFFYIKLPAIVLALINAVAVTRSRAWHDATVGQALVTTTPALMLAGALSLVLWATALAMGRMMGYW